MFIVNTKKTFKIDVNSNHPAYSMKWPAYLKKLEHKLKYGINSILLNLAFLFPAIQLGRRTRSSYIEHHGQTMQLLFSIYQNHQPQQEAPAFIRMQAYNVLYV
jgi:hypothetical protein